MAQINGLTVGLDVDLRGLQTGINEAISRIGGLEREVNQVSKSTNGLTSAFSGFAGAVGGIFAVDKVIEFGAKILETTAQFQKLQAVLANTLGSQEAGAEAFAQISQFAAQTNFSVLELTDSYVKLANQGFKPTTAQLENLADLANSTGKSFDQLTEAILDAQTGEFERLKEFGIQASKSGDQVTFAFKGVKTTVDATNSSIRNYVLGLGDLQGVSGATAAISQTLGGQLSNLGDAFDGLFNAIGSSGSGAISKFISLTTQAIGVTTDLIKALDAARKLQEQDPSLSNNEALKQAIAQINDLEYASQEAAKELAIFNRVNQETGQVDRQAQEAIKEGNKLYAERIRLALILGKEVDVTSGQVTDTDLTEDRRRALETQLEITRKVLSGISDIEKQRVADAQANQDKEVAAIKKANEEKKKEQQKLIDAYNEIFKKLEVANRQESVFGDAFDLGSERVKILETGINSLLEKGFKPASKEVQTLVDLLGEAKRMSRDIAPVSSRGEVNVDYRAKDSGIFKGDVITPQIDIDPLIGYERQLQLTREQLELLNQLSNDTGIGLNALSTEFEEAGLSLNDFIEKTYALSEAKAQFQDLFAVLRESASQGLTDVVADLATGTEDAVGSVKKLLGSIAAQLGAGLISIGTPMLLVPGLQGQALAYIGAGTALKIVAAALGKSASGGSSAGGGSSRSVSTGFSQEEAGIGNTNKPTVQVASASSVQGSTANFLDIRGEFVIRNGYPDLILGIRKAEAKETKTGGNK